LNKLIDAFGFLKTGVLAKCCWDLHKTGWLVVYGKSSEAMQAWFKGPGLGWDITLLFCARRIELLDHLSQDNESPRRANVLKPLKIMCLSNEQTF